MAPSGALRAMYVNNNVLYVSEQNAMRVLITLAAKKTYFHENPVRAGFVELQNAGDIAVQQIIIQNKKASHLNERSLLPFF